MMIYLVYRITNLLSGKEYIGCHKTSNVEDGYMGSGTLIKRDIQKYGIANFKKEILAKFDNSLDMFAKEKELVRIHPLSYNLKEGGCGGFDHLNNGQANSSHSPEHMQTMSNKIQSKLSSNKDFKQIVFAKRKDGINERIAKDPSYKEKLMRNIKSFEGQKHSSASKAKISAKGKGKLAGKANPNFGKFWITNEVQSKMIASDAIIPFGWRKGKIQK